MTALVVALILSNAVLLSAVLAQRFKVRAAAVGRCESCPFVTAAAPVVRIPRVALPVYDESPTVVLTRAG